MTRVQILTSLPRSDGPSWNVGDIVTIADEVATRLIANGAAIHDDPANIPGGSKVVRMLNCFSGPRPLLRKMVVLLPTAEADDLIAKGAAELYVAPGAAS